MMEKLKYPTMSDIRASHASKAGYERYLFASRFLFRPVSFPSTWLLLRFGLSSEGASWLSGFFALCGFTCLFWPAAPLLWPGIAFFMLFNLFDCIDGNIARVMNTGNPYGRFLDSIMWWADMLFWVAVGVTVWRSPGLREAGDALGFVPGLWLGVGAACALLADYAAYVDSVFDLALRAPWEKLVTNVPATPTPLEGKAGPELFARILVHNLRVRETHYLLFAAAAAFGAADMLLACMAVFYALLVVLLLVVYCGRGRRVRAAELGEKGPT